jgi:hypothetical protein
VIDGVSVGVQMSGCNSTANRILGNYIGMGPAGVRSTGVDLGMYFIGGRQNVVGGTDLGSVNTIAGAEHGIYMGNGTGAGNRIEGNLFGTDPTGTTILPEGWAIVLQGNVPPQIIGGTRPFAGNFIVGGTGSWWGDGVYIETPQRGTLVSHNTFGGTPARPNLGLGSGVVCINSSPRVADNRFTQCGNGLFARGPRAQPVAVRNVFVRCGRAVRIEEDAAPNLGSLANTRASDDGGNRFDPRDRYHIVNHGARTIMAQGNDFGTTDAAQIGAKIIDQDDRPTYGPVQVLPLLTSGTTGDVVAASRQALSLSATCAPAGASRVEIGLTSSAPAAVSVELLNVAGRHIRWLARERAVEAGLTRLLWDARDDAGLIAPAGAYLVRASARSVGGAQAQTLTTATLAR